ncbi:filamentous hemagglutinin family protein [Sinobacterium caligoides]|uniref:Filamentous hemagglutinin family protein n=1 Tax=Sinobacterium caligoides TaxID=933926 RepID=A0A3N2DZX8_9GAMM|nr:hemagglutinin repeat-containing protein [Sinobacterium caligoides]ROS05421.1 filamentous hemagglutinin family protein [Sinobacterium caligoides]
MLNRQWMRSVASLLTFSLIFQPITAQAGGVVVDSRAAASKRPTALHAANGVPIVNIAKPGANGVSHNQYERFSIEQRGLILNNANDLRSSQLAGYIDGNPNLAGSQASIILNEVTSRQRSVLAGYAEVVGGAAQVVVANPNGISCNGCGFINTPQATLTTGVPQYDQSGRLVYDVNRGDIAIDSLNASNVARLNLLSRAIKVNGDLQAKELNIITGRNRIEHSNLKVTAKADDGSEKPQFAVDSALLGGMYANSIHLIGTEAGVGVRLAGDMVAGVGDLQLTAAGNIQLANSSAAQALSVSSDSDVTLTGIAQADRLTVNADGDVTLTGTAQADRLTVSADGDVTLAGTAQADHVTLNAKGDVGLQSDATVMAAQAIAVGAHNIDNSGQLIAGVNAQGEVTRSGRLTLQAEQQLRNSGRIRAGDDIELAASTMNNDGGTIVADAVAVSVVEALSNNSGAILAAKTLDLSAAALANRAGNIASEKTLKLDIARLDNSQGRIQGAEADLSAETVVNREGVIVAADGLTIETQASLSNGGDIVANNVTINTQGDFDNDAGVVDSNGDLSINAENILNQSGEILVRAGQAQLMASSGIDNGMGSIQSAADSLLLEAGLYIDNQRGLILSINDRPLVLRSNGWLNNDEGQTVSAGSTDLHAGALSNRSGLIDSGVELSITATSVINEGGRVLSGDTLRIESDVLDNRSGEMLAAADLLLDIDQGIDNTTGLLQGKNLSSQSRHLDNADGVIVAEQAVTLGVVEQLTNGGDINAGSVSVLSDGAIDNAGGRIEADRLSLVAAGQLTNGTDGLIAGYATDAEALLISADAVDNQHGRIQSHGQSLSLDVTRFDNHGGELLLLGEGELALQSQAEIDNQSGSIASHGRLLLRADNLDNRAGAILSSSDTRVLVDGAINNRQGSLQANGLEIVAGSLDNQLASILDLGVGTTTITLSEALSNVGGRIESRAQQLNITAADIDNRDAKIYHVGGGGALLQADSAIDNTGGDIRSVGALSVATGTQLDNSSGIIAAGDALSLSATDSVINNSGTIEAAAALEVVTAALSNRDGMVSAKGGQSSRFELTSFDNEGGTLYSRAASLWLSASQQLSNVGGRLLHAGQQGFDLLTASLVNRSGEIVADSTLNIEAGGDVDNRSGDILSQDSLTIAAKGLDNRAGKLQHNHGMLVLQLQKQLNNANGIIVGNDITLNAQQLLNANGLMQASHNLLIDLDIIALVKGSQLNAGNLLRLRSGSSFSNAAGARLLASGALTIDASGNVTNSGELSSVADLRLEGRSLTNNQQGVISAGADGDYIFTSTVTNTGALTAANDLLLRGKDVTNRGALAAGKDLTLELSGKLNNNQGAVFAGDDLSVYAQRGVTNDEGDIFAINNLLIAANANQQRTGWINNLSGTIEAWGGSLKLFANEIVNRKKTFNYSVDDTVSNVGTYCKDSGTCGGDHVYFHYDYIKTYSTRITADSAVAMLLSGGNMRLDAGKIENKFSLIASNGNLTMTGGSLSNESLTVGTRTEENEFYTGEITDGTHKRFYRDYIAPFNRGEISIETLEANLPAGAGSWHTVDTQVTASSQVYGSILARGNISGDFTGQINNTSIVAHASTNALDKQAANTSANTGTMQQVATVDKNTEQDSQAAPIDSTQQASIGAGSERSDLSPAELPAQVVDNNALLEEAGHAVNPIDLGGFSLPSGGGLFVVVPEANQPYLVETNPAFTEYTNFISSDYMLERLGVDANTTTKRLGDGFYENRLLRDSVFNSSGQRYLNSSYNSDYDQYKQLMDNALVASASLGLGLGMALTAEQVAGLSNDIVWLVEQQVAGQTVLVPVLYLASGVQLRQNGALIAGENVALRTDGGVTNSGEISAEIQQSLIADGDLLNTGVLRADQMTLMTESNLTNEFGGVIDGNRLTIDTRRDLINQRGGQISGGELSLRAREGDIRNITDLEVLRQGSKTLGEFDTIRTKLGATSSIAARDNLSLNAGNDILLQGSETQAGGDVVLEAGQDINIEALETRERQSNYFSDGYEVVDKTRHVAATVAGGGDVTITAGAALTLKGSDVAAGGDATLSAAKDVNILSVTDRDSYLFHEEEEKSFGRSSSETISRSSDTQQGSSVIAGGNASVDSGQTIDLIASQVAADGDVSLTAAKDINVLAGVDYHSSLVDKSSSSTFSSSREGEASQSATLAEASLNSAGGDVILDAGNDINVIGSDISAANDVSLTAFEQVNIAAGMEQSQSESWSEEGGFFTGGDFYQQSIERNGEGEQSARAASVSAGNDVIIDAGSARVVGSDVSAGHDIDVTTDIGDIEILAVAENQQADSYSREVSVQLGDVVAASTAPHETMAVEDGQFKASIGKATYDAYESESASTSHRGSHLSAGNSVVLDSAADVMIEGSDLIADNDGTGSGNAIIMAADDVTIKHVTDTQESSSKETHGSAEASFVVQHQAVEVVKAAQQVQEAKDQLKQAEQDYRRYEKELDQLKEGLVGLEQDYANKVPGVSQGDLLEMRELVKEVEDDETWYQAGIAAAAVDLTSASTLLAQQATAAATSTSSYAFGFNAGLQLDISASQTESEQRSTQAVASTVSGQNVVIQTGKASDNTTHIAGSHVRANEALVIDTGTLDVTASRDTANSSHETESASLQVGVTVFGASGGATVSGSYDRSKGGDKSTTYTNSQLAGDTVVIDTTGDTTIAGGNVQADELLLANVGGDLTVESQQNRASGDSKGFGISGGFGFGDSSEKSADSLAKDGGSASSAVRNPFGSNEGQQGGIDHASSANGSVYSNSSRYQEKETVVSSLTSGGTADITVGGNTAIIGGIIATLDEDGNDLGNLSLSTETLTYSDLSNTRYSEEKSAGGSSSIGLNGNSNQGQEVDANLNAPANPNPNSDNDETRLNTTSGQYANSSSYQKSNSLATLGEGDISVSDEENSDDLDRLNRDVSTITKDIVDIDRQQGDIDMTVDTRLLTEEGREVIKQDFSKIAETTSRIAGAAWGEIQAMQVDMDDVPVSIRETSLSPELALNITKNLVRNGVDPDAAAKFIADPDNAARIQSIYQSAKAYAEVDAQAESLGIDSEHKLQQGLGQQISDNGREISGDKTSTTFVAGRRNTLGESLLIEADGLGDYVSTLPTEEAAIMGLAIQASMGPAKAIVGIAGSALAATLIGDQIEEYKDDIAIAGSAGVTPDLNKAGIAEEDAYQQMTYGEGDSVVDGARFMVDVILGVSLVGRSTGKKAGSNSSADSGTMQERDGATKGADSTLSRKAAFRQAKEKAGIPKSQQPSNTYHEKIRDQQGHVEGRVYEFKNADGSTATIREHTLGHELGNHGSHFNSELRNAQGIKQSLKKNADSHTYIKQD